MNIREKLEPIVDRIVEINNNANGMGIGTGLEIYFEKKFNAILPSEIGYQFIFNMSGKTEHHFYEKNNQNNFIIVN